MLYSKGVPFLEQNTKPFLLLVLDSLNFFSSKANDDIYIYHYQTPRELRARINKFMKSYNEEHHQQNHSDKTPYEVYYGIKAAF